METATKNFILQLVRDGYEADDVIRQIHWGSRDLAAFGVKATPEFVASALEGFYEKHAQGLTTHAKKYANFNDVQTWKMGALAGSLGQISGAKVISYGLDNRSKNLPMSHADGFLSDKDTGVRKMTLDLIQFSNLRTGWFASEFFKLAFKATTDIEVVIIGAGSLSEACILMLNCVVPDQIKRIQIISKSGTSNFSLVKRLAKIVKIPLEATNDRAQIPLADYLITATNAGEPVVEAQEIGFNTAVLSLGIDDLPDVYFHRLIEKRIPMIGDDLSAMQERNVDSLTLFYSRNGQQLTVEGKRDGAVNIGDILTNPNLKPTLNARHSVFLPVGLIGNDITVMEAALKALRVAIHHAAFPEKAECLTS